MSKALWMAVSSARWFVCLLPRKASDTFLFRHLLVGFSVCYHTSEGATPVRRTQAGSLLWILWAKVYPNSCTSTCLAVLET